MSENKSASLATIGFGDSARRVFIGLKLTHVISWSWWWVLSPFWIPAVLLVVVFIVLILFAFTYAFFETVRK